MSLGLASLLAGCAEGPPAPSSPPPASATTSPASAAPASDDAEQLAPDSTRQQARQAMLPGPRLRADDTVWNWGVAAAGQELRHLFVLHNDGDAPVRIKRIRPT